MVRGAAVAIGLTLLSGALSGAHAAGAIEVVTSTSLGEFGGVAYSEHECRFVGDAEVDGATIHYDTTAWITAPTDASKANGRVVLDVVNTVSLARFGEIRLARPQIGDDLLFGKGFVLASVRWEKTALDPAKGDAFTPADAPRTVGFAILADFADALRATSAVVGPVTKVYAFAYSQGATVLRSLLQSPPAGHHAPLFDASLLEVAGAMRNTLSGPGSRATDTVGSDYGAFGEYVPAEGPVPASAGLVMMLNSESDVSALSSHLARQDGGNVRSYELAGSPHIPLGDFAVAFGADIPSIADLFKFGDDEVNPLRWWPVVRALFVALDAWATSGAAPPASAWLGPAGDATIARDGSGNASGGVRLPDVAAGRGVYGGSHAATEDIYLLVSGSFTDRSSAITHDDYVAAFTAAADDLTADGFLLAGDADALVAAATASSIGTATPTTTATPAADDGGCASAPTAATTLLAAVLALMLGRWRRRA